MRQRVVALLRSGDAAWTSPIRLELWNGARGEREKRGLREMEAVLPELPIDTATWERSFALARKARERGLACPAIDLLIFACVQQHGAKLERVDTHFTALAELV